MKTKILLGFVFFIGCALVVSGCGTTPTNTPTNAVTNMNNAGINNDNSNDNTNGTDVISSSGAEYSGKVFLKGYKTPSESYGMLTDTGSEISFGSYDSMKESFRQYVGDRLKVKFSSICRTNETDCCRTLFPFCGTVQSWEPL